MEQGLKQAYLRNLLGLQGKLPQNATPQDHYLALAHAVRERMLPGWIRSGERQAAAQARTVAYLSAEFLLGPHLANNLLNLGLTEEARAAVQELGLDFDELLRQEAEPALGNGGLGRLAACFIDSMATLSVPAVAYGIRYEYGMFHQDIVDGGQIEKTDEWLRFSNPWELQRPEWTVEVRFGGHTEHYHDEHGKLRVRWHPQRIVHGVPYDTPIPGYRNDTANTLRLWSAEAPEDFDFAVFNRGDYYGAVHQKVTSENLSKVLYPNDALTKGKELRLEQQYFFVACALQDMLRILREQGLTLEQFPEKFTIQLNDTHPAIAIPELMRLLVDEHGLSWDESWSITTRSFAFTNHTLLPEALEVWPLPMFERILPRHLEIIHEINRRFLQQIRIHFMGDDARITRMSLIDESGERCLRMAHLACVGSYSINGVAALHTELLERELLRDFHELWPAKFSSKTNGVTPRRWLALANPRLSALLTGTLGEGWLTDLQRLQGLEARLGDTAFADTWRAIKRANKCDLAALIRARTGVTVNPDALFDVQVKRMHEYKRQHLNILHVAALYLRLKAAPQLDFPPRVVIFSGKAAPGYEMAKLIIRLIMAVAEVVNGDPAVGERLKVVFLPNFGVSLGERIYPAADLSEQISTAGKEASGTGNMKMQMNGALTIGTMDGANIEIREQVGPDNFFDFGLGTEQIRELRALGYHPTQPYAGNEELRQVLELLRAGFFSRGDTQLFQPLLDRLLLHDPYFVLADYAGYAACQQRVCEAWLSPERWTRMSIINVARSGRFSSDRSIREYCEDIWRIAPPGMAQS